MLQNCFWFSGRRHFCLQDTAGSMPSHPEKRKGQSQERSLTEVAVPGGGAYFYRVCVWERVSIRQSLIIFRTHTHMHLCANKLTYIHACLCVCTISCMSKCERSRALSVARGVCVCWENRKMPENKKLSIHFHTPAYTPTHHPRSHVSTYLSEHVCLCMNICVRIRACVWTCESGLYAFNSVSGTGRELLDGLCIILWQLDWVDLFLLCCFPCLSV